MSKKIAIITARGGSKRIPNKNIKDFCGKPIISYSIEAALEANLFDEVMVSTDSEEIAKIARSYGASVPFLRSEENSNDFATTSQVILEVIECYEKLGQKFEYAACIYPTAPFVTAEKLQHAMVLLEQNKVVEVMPVVKFSYPPQRGYIIKEEKLVMTNPEHVNTRSQDLESIYHDCGQFYCYDIARYKALNGQITEGLLPIVVKESEVQDIDTLEDWKLAELKYQMMRKVEK